MSDFTNDLTDNDSWATTSCATTGQVLAWNAGQGKFECVWRLAVNNVDEAQVDSWVSNNGYASTSSLHTVATSGNYNHLSNRPTIPTRTSQLVNDSYFLSSDDTISYNDLGDKPAVVTQSLSCTTNQILKSAGSGVWRCATDESGGGLENGSVKNEHLGAGVVTSDKLANQINVPFIAGTNVGNVFMTLGNCPTHAATLAKKWAPRTCTYDTWCSTAGKWTQGSENAPTCTYTDEGYIYNTDYTCTGILEASLCIESPDSVPGESGGGGGGGGYGGGGGGGIGDPDEEIRPR